MIFWFQVRKELYEYSERFELMKLFKTKVHNKDVLNSFKNNEKFLDQDNRFKWLGI
jgi:hypothetical protein